MKHQACARFFILFALLIGLTACGQQEFSVIYDANGADQGVVPIDPNSYQRFETVQVLPNHGDLSKAGYVFAGWTSKPDGKGASYQANEQFRMKGDALTLYARWHTPQQCLMRSCLLDTVSCVIDGSCRDWLNCMGECGDDEMLCPTVCGAFFQSENINELTQCSLDSGCVEIDFSDLPACQLPSHSPIELDDIDGFWWVSAIQGHDYVLYDDCQRFIFKTLNSLEIDVANSTSVRYKDESKVVDNLGQFTRTDAGYLQLIYDNWVGYTELYYPYYRSENLILVHVCSQDTGQVAHDYGTLILSRVPMSELDKGELQALEQAVEQIFESSLNEFRAIGTQQCPNG